jgi:hypothetical protein
MKISELVEELEHIRHKYGDLYVSAAYGPGPELTIHGIDFTEAGPLPSSSPANDQNDLPVRVVLELKKL